MAKKKFSPTEQMNVRIMKNVLKNARVYVKKNKTRLGIIVNDALDSYLRANVK